MEKSIMIQGKNNYSWEGSETNKTWKIKVTHGMELLTSTFISALEDFKENIFFNDLNCEYWFMDFKIDNVWIEGSKINPTTMEMEIGLY